ncbi:MAG: LLM class F420-dependent oxidoreductase [Verrucomicrobiota bacterium]
MTTALDRLGRVGVWNTGVTNAPAAELRDGLAEYEALGYPAIWFGEAFSRESLSTAALTLSWTRELVVATGITNVYARDATAANAGMKTIGEAFPGRFVLGLGISHQHPVSMRGQAYGPPVTTMRTYLDAIESATYLGQEPSERVPIVLAALGPRMLDLARDRTDGAHPYFVPPEHTAQARERLGPGKLLAPEQAVLLTDDEQRARELAREHCAFYLTAPNYRNNMLRLGFEERDLENGGSDRLLEQIVVWGDEDAILARVRAHLDAGADHVCIQTLPSGELDLDTLRRLAPALLEL